MTLKLKLGLILPPAERHHTAPDFFQSMDGVGEFLCRLAWISQKTRQLKHYSAGKMEKVAISSITPVSRESNAHSAAPYSTYCEGRRLSISPTISSNVFVPNKASRSAV